MNGYEELQNVYKVYKAKVNIILNIRFKITEFNVFSNQMSRKIQMKITKIMQYF